MIPAPSTPIDECTTLCTPPERHDITDRAPPYDGVRIWGDLEVVRAQLEKQAPKVRPG